MVKFSILQQSHGADCRKGILSYYRFDIVAEVYDVGFPEA